MDVPYIIVKRVLDGEEIEDMYDSREELDAFYESLKTQRPTTTALNTQEFEEFFSKIMDERPGDIIHVCLSSGLSLTYDNAVKAIPTLKKKYPDRKVHVIDSRSATTGQGLQVDRLIELRDSGVSTEDAIKIAEELKINVHIWAMISDLGHLKRGGRISGAKAMIGTVLGVKPILHVAKSGKIAIENKMKGTKNAVNYIIEKIVEHGDMKNDDFLDSTLYLIQTTESDNFTELKKQVTQRFPTLNIKEAIIGPVVGSHVGGSACGAQGTADAAARPIERAPWQA